MSSIDDATAWLDKLPSEVKAAMRQAISTGARQTRVEVSRAIRRQAALKASYINQHLQTKHSRGEFESRIVATKRPVGLFNYSGRQLTKSAKRARGDASRAISQGRKAAGVSVRVKPTGKRKRMPNAFTLRLKGSGKTGMAIRTGSNRSDIKMLYGPSVDQMFRSDIDDHAATASKHAGTEFARQLKRRGIL